MTVFVFPLGNMVFHPGTSKPLNIFEPRYLQMVKDSLSTSTPIALGFVDEPKEGHQFRMGEKLNFVREVAGIGMPLVIEERDDGTMLIFLQSIGKVRLGKVSAPGAPYIICNAEKLEEAAQIRPENTGLYMTLQKILIQWIHQHIPDENNRQQFLKQVQTPTEVVGTVCGYLIADQDMQQLILEASDINEKIQLLAGLVSSGEVL
jgi:ATP-dependent Lon protease